MVNVKAILVWVAPALCLLAFASSLSAAVARYSDRDYGSILQHELIVENARAQLKISLENGYQDEEDRLTKIIGLKKFVDDNFDSQVTLTRWAAAMALTTLAAFGLAAGEAIAPRGGGEDTKSAIFTSAIIGVGVLTSIIYVILLAVIMRDGNEMADGLYVHGGIKVPHEKSEVGFHLAGVTIGLGVLASAAHIYLHFIGTPADITNGPAEA